MQVARLAIPLIDNFRDRALPRKPPDRGLCHWPDPSRPEHRLVVEADRHQPVHAIGHAEEVPVRGWPARLPPNSLPRHGIGDAGADPRLAVDVDHAVGTVTGEAIQPTAAMILEGA